jgi:hypothetical protein
LLLKFPIACDWPCVSLEEFAAILLSPSPEEGCCLPIFLMRSIIEPTEFSDRVGLFSWVDEAAAVVTGD